MKTVFAQSATDTAISDTTHQISKLIEAIITKVPLWIGAFILILFSVFIAKIARRIIENKLAERGIEEEHKELQILGGRIVYSGILVLGFTVALKIAGIDLTTIIAAVAFGIGFALKDLIMNFLAGVFILISRHFTIGDFINIGGTVGKVIEIQSRVTILQAIDGTKVIVPNADLFKKQITSFTGNPFRRIEVEALIDYRNDVGNAVKICIDTMKHTRGVLAQPAPAVLVDSFGENGVVLKVRAWVDSKGGWLKIKSDLAENLKKNFDKYGITIPWPIRTIVNDNEKQINEMDFEEAQMNAQAQQNQAPQVQQVQAQDTVVQPPAPIQQAMTPATAPVMAPQSDEDEDRPLKPLSEM